MAEPTRSKRDYGDGSITKRKDGTWTARIMIGRNVNENPKIKAFYGKSEAEVKRKLKAYKQEIPNLPNADVGKQSLYEYISYWLTVYKKGNLRPKSYDTLEYTIEQFIKPSIGFLQL